MEDKTLDILSNYGSYDEKDKQTKDILDRLKRLLNLGQKGAKDPTAPPLKAVDKSQFLSPEQVDKIVKKELNNFEVIDLTNRSVLIPASLPITAETIELLRQLSVVFPSALYIRQVTEFKEAGDIKSSYQYPSDWNYKE